MVNVPGSVWFALKSNAAPRHPDNRHGVSIARVQRKKILERKMQILTIARIGGVRHRWRRDATVPTAVERADQPAQDVQHGDAGTKTAGRPGPARRRRRAWRKARRLLQAALFAGVRGAACTVGGAGAAWLLYWLAQR